VAEEIQVCLDRPEEEDCLVRYNIPQMVEYSVNKSMKQNFIIDEFSTGDRGDKGNVGPMGFIGESGLPGLDGISGIPGSRGTCLLFNLHIICMSSSIFCIHQ
jgi:hypothetical protein